MITTRVTVEIARPVDEVFTFVTTPANFPRWAGAVVAASRQTSPGPVGVGTTFTQQNRLLGRRFTTALRVVAYEPGRRFEYASTAGPIGFAGHYTFAPTAGGTRFTAVDETTPPGLLRRLAPLLRPLAQRQIARNLARLKAVLEAGAA
jgi:uncharacterized protein YndB with AHSA1/START domain